MEPYNLSTVIQLYSAGLISRAALEQETELHQTRARRMERRSQSGGRDAKCIDMRMDTKGVWRLA